MEERDGVDCLKVTTGQIREEMLRLQQQLTLLKEFGEASYTDTVCDDGEHDWQHHLSWDSDDGMPVLPTDLLSFWRQWTCKKCGVLLKMTYTEPEKEWTEDPWAALRDEEE
jgi:hypothetical protein